MDFDPLRGSLALFLHDDTDGNTELRASRHIQQHHHMADVQHHRPTEKPTEDYTGCICAVQSIYGQDNAKIIAKLSYN